MALKDILARAGNACEFCGATDGLEAVDIAPAGEIALCPACRGEEDVQPDHWRCLEGAAWTAEPAVQLAVWRKLGTLDAAWAAEAREGMALLPEVQGWAETPLAVEHRDSNGALLAQGLAPFEAAAGGALLHGLAGDVAAADGARGPVTDTATVSKPHRQRRGDSGGGALLRSAR